MSLAQPGKSTVTTAGGPSTSHMGLAAPGQQPLKDEKMNPVLEKLVDTQPLVGSGFKFVCRCKLCGWQTLQMDEEAGKQLVKNHAQVHIPQIQATMQGEAE